MVYSRYITVNTLQDVMMIMIIIITITKGWGRPKKRSLYGAYTIGWTVQGSKPGRSKRFFSSPKRPDLLWSLPSLLFYG
jgi:hypothetical protein